MTAYLYTVFIVHLLVFATAFCRGVCYATFLLGIWRQALMYAPSELFLLEGTPAFYLVSLLKTTLLTSFPPVLYSKTVFIQYLASIFIATYRILQYKTFKAQGRQFYTCLSRSHYVQYSSFDSSTLVKLVWNNPLIRRKHLRLRLTELRATLIKEIIYHCISEANSTTRLASYPPSSQTLSPSYSYATRFANKVYFLRHQ